MKHHRLGNISGRLRDKAFVPIMRLVCSSMIVACLLFCASSCTSTYPAEKVVMATAVSLPNDKGNMPFPQGSLSLNVEEAIMLGLQRNRALNVERLTPRIRETREMEERARFDPRLGATTGLGSDSIVPRVGRGIEFDEVRTVRRREIGLELEQRLPSGTTLGADTRFLIEDLSFGDQDSYLLESDIFLTQPLLQGGGFAVNRATIRQAEIDTRISLHELYAFVEIFVDQIESAYWDYVLALRRVAIVRESLDLAEKQLREIERRIDVGALAPTERAAAKAETALRREALINAQSNADTLRLEFLRMLNPGHEWQAELQLVEEPAFEEIDDLPVAERVRHALDHRPEILQARLMTERGELDVVRTRNGLLPRMDFFITLGRTGYADSFSSAADALGSAETGWSTGLRMAMPLGRREDRARHERSVLSSRQAELALGNLEQVVELDVRKAVIELMRTAEQISATAATRTLQEEKLRAEEEKFRVGTSTSLLVAQAQRDLMEGRIAEVQAVTAYLKARSRLYRMEGSLLERRGIDVPAW